MVAIRDFESAKKSSKKFRPGKTRIFIFFAIIALFGVMVFGCILPNYAKASQYENETAQIRTDIENLDAESAEIVDSLDHQDDLYEKIAREEYGYCKPGEKVFYSSSFGE